MVPALAEKSRQRPAAGTDSDDRAWPKPAAAVCTQQKTARTSSSTFGRKPMSGTSCLGHRFAAFKLE
jgi:hypothetical protein